MGSLQILASPFFSFWTCHLELSSSLSGIPLHSLLLNQSGKPTSSLLLTYLSFLSSLFHQSLTSNACCMWCVCACVCVCARACVHACVRACVRVCARTHARMHAHTCMRACVCTHTHTHTTCVCMHVCVCMHACVCSVNVINARTNRAS